MENIIPIDALTLDRRPDVVRFWPRDNQYAVVGTYTLLEDEPSEGEESASQQRIGSLNLIRIDNHEINVIETLPTPFGVYDLQFAPAIDIQNGNADAGSFAVASSTGSVALYRLLASDIADSIFPNPTIVHLYTIQYFPKDILITSLDWRRHDLAAMTLSSGQVCLGRLSDPSVDAVLSVELMQHDFQAWHCSFVVTKEGSETPFGLISGGDDATLRYTPIGADQISELELGGNLTVSPTQTMPWADKKIHQAGVTAVMPIGRSSTGFLVITGSYDDHIRLLHIPDTGRREVLAEAYLEGGVFRIKLVQKRGEGKTGSGGTEQSHALLVSCMQAGARIVNLHKTEGQWRFDVNAKFDKNAGTLLYASDCRSTGSDYERTIVSTSFEDRKLYLWKATVSS
ncbi:uncharacterized protein N0V89_004745 [Didymosphaeria variabile]|uniref:Uncharacterized protein n=1 Tax=Didymosphaeria variabile TaxID=1932322 RepID=A0A9W9CCP2_9PLEO|nr:uncharacterized protein N0V89_004745 [Didymosphaeria variabile]KAJ4356709.1 hypothetical protein N0V89_004745 [Didymosphaeria variabile]